MQASSESSAADLIAPSNSKFQRLCSKLAEQGGHSEKTVSSVVDYEMELKEYLAMLAFNVDDPITYWLSQEQSFPLLCKLAINLFLVTATSAPIERVFSHAAIATYGRRNRLDAILLNAELLMKLNCFLFT